MWVPWSGSLWWNHPGYLSGLWRSLSSLLTSVGWVPNTRDWPSGSVRRHFWWPFSELFFQPCECSAAPVPDWVIYETTGEEGAEHTLTWWLWCFDTWLLAQQAIVHSWCCAFFWWIDAVLCRKLRGSNRFGWTPHRVLFQAARGL